jgi:hypothetical protein
MFCMGDGGWMNLRLLLVFLFVSLCVHVFCLYLCLGLSL